MQATPYTHLAAIQGRFPPQDVTITSKSVSLSLFRLKQCNKKICTFCSSKDIVKNEETNWKVDNNHSLKWYRLFWPEQFCQCYCCQSLSVSGRSWQRSRLNTAWHFIEQRMFVAFQHQKSTHLAAVTEQQWFHLSAEGVEYTHSTYVRRYIRRSPQWHYVTSHHHW